MVIVRAGSYLFTNWPYVRRDMTRRIVVVKKLPMMFAATASLAPCADAQVAPPSVPFRPVAPPIAYIEPDSGERQTLPAYRIACDLRDSAGRLSEVVLLQSGGRGIPATESELRRLSVLRRFVSTKVDIQVEKDTGGIFHGQVMDTAPAIDQYRWEKIVGRGEKVTLRDDAKSFVTFTFSGIDSDSKSSLSAPVLVSRQLYGGWPSASHVGFCIVDITPQQPLSAEEEAEYRTPSD